MGAAAAIAADAWGTCMDLTEQPRRVPDDADDGFRLRGRETTRLVSLVGAAFAFSLTLLVIFLDDLPTTIAGLRDIMLYSVGFGVLPWLLWQLTVHAPRQADRPALDAMAVSA